MPDPTTLLWAYVDDVTLHISLHHLCATLDIIAAAMRVYHCYLQPAKCHVCVPSLNSTPREDWPEELREAETRGFAVDHTSILLLGSDVAPAHAVTLASEGTALAATVDATAKRAAKAVRLLECCHQLAMSNAPCRRQVASAMYYTRHCLSCTLLRCPCSPQQPRAASREHRQRTCMGSFRSCNR